MSETLKDQQTWHKAIVLVFRKLGIVEMLITDEDIKPLQGMEPDELPAMVAASAADGLHLILSTAKEAREFQATVVAEAAKESPIVIPKNSYIH
jgi:hypothetical protein